MAFSAAFAKVPEGHIGFVAELPGANTQRSALAEAKAKLREAIAMTLEANRALAEESLADLQEDVIRETVLV